MRRSQTGLRPDQGRQAAATRRRKPALERLEERALLSAVTEFPVLTAASQPFGIVTGPDGNLWFTETSANNIASINPTTGVVQEFPVPTPSASPLEIVAGPAGSNTLFFTENTAAQIGEINTTTHTITEIPIPLPSSNSPAAPFGITLGSDGNIYFTDANPSLEQIGELNLSTDTITETPLPTSTGAGLTEITTGSDGNLWFVESLANKIGTVSPANISTGTISEFTIPTANASPFGITSGPNGNLWFTEQSADQIGTINPTSDLITEYPVPTAGASPQGITSGPDGNLWFTEHAANQIGRINPSSGAVEEFGIPTTDSGPNGITKGPDSALWFTEGNANQIGRLDPTQILLATGTTITASAQSAFTGVVATFTSATVNPQASDFSATIDWGDGTTTAATGIAPSNSGTGFEVAGTHTYAAEGTFSVTVTITDSFGDTASTTTTADVTGPVTPPVNGPIPTVTALVRTGVGRQPSQITLTVSTALNPVQAEDALNYSIIGLGRNGVLDPPAQVSAGQGDDQYIHVLTAVYDSTNNTVTLTTYEHLSLTQIYQLTIHSGPPVATANGMTPDGVQSPLGVYLAGVDNTPGTDYVADFQGGVIPVSTVRVRTRHVRTPEIVHRHLRHG